MVSIIVTHKKDTLYLKDCLESIAEQQFKDYETILVVDHTEDNIEPLIEEFKDKINLKVFYLEDKHGVSSARNLGLDKATGEYVYFLDNDDYLYGDSIKLLLDVMDEDTDMAYGRMKHTWFQKQAFNDSQGDDDDNNDNGADDKTGHIEKARVDHADTIIDHHRNGSGQHPGRNDNADGQKDQNGWHGFCDFL